MSLSAGIIAPLVIAAVFGVTRSQTAGTGTDIQVFSPIKNCSQESIYYTQAPYQFKCGFYRKQICRDNFETCLVQQGYKNTRNEVCRQEVGPKFVSDDLCRDVPSNYLDVLQSSCCTKTKMREQFPDRSFAETQDIIENCYDKVNCPDTDSCNEATPNANY